MKSGGGFFHELRGHGEYSEHPGSADRASTLHRGTGAASLLLDLGLRFVLHRPFGFALYAVTLGRHRKRKINADSMTLNLLL